MPCDEIGCETTSTQSRPQASSVRQSLRSSESESHSNFNAYDAIVGAKYSHQSQLISDSFENVHFNDGTNDRRMNKQTTIPFQLYLQQQKVAFMR